MSAPPPAHRCPAGLRCGGPPAGGPDSGAPRRCNGQGGRWVAGPGGALLATSGLSTLIGCDNVLLARWLTSASRAGSDGDVLVFLNSEGIETGRLRRDS